MATLISKATGNFSSASTWGVADTTSLQLTGGATSTIGTTNVDSVTFVPGAITVDALMLRIASRVASPSGTFTATLRNSTDGVNVASVTINVSDISADGNGYYVLAFGSSVTLLAGKTYLLRYVCSSGNNVGLSRSSTLNDFVRALRTTTTGAPAASDRLFVVGEHTGSGTGNDFTVTMDNNSATSFGALDVNKRGTLTYTTSASTQLRMAGSTNIWSGGVFSVGASGAAIGSGNTAILEYDCASAGQYRLTVNAGGTFNAYGNPLTYVKTKLNADAAAAATALTTVDSTGWVLNDQVLIGNSTSRSSVTANSTWEIRTVNSTSTTTLNLTAGLGGAKTGTNTNGQDKRTDIGNVTRNVKIRAVNTSFATGITNSTGGILALQYVECVTLGSGSNSIAGIVINNSTSGSASVTYSSIHSCANSSADAVAILANAINVTLDNNVIGNYTNSSASLLTLAAAAASVAITNNLLIGMPNAGQGINMNVTGSIAFAFNNNTISGIGSLGAAISGQFSTLGNWDNNVVYGCTGSGFYLQSITRATGAEMPIRTLTGWRHWLCANGLLIGQCSSEIIILSDLRIWGCSSRALFLATSTVKLISPRLDSDTTFTTTNAIEFSAGGSSVEIVGGLLGQISAFTTANIAITAGSSRVGAYNTLWSGGDVSFSGVSRALINDQEYIYSDKHQGVAGAYKRYTKYGSLTRNTAQADADACVELRCIQAANVLGMYGEFKFPVRVDSGVAKTVTVKMKKGASYNGNDPRMQATFLGTEVVAETSKSVTTSYADYSITIPALSITEDGVAMVSIRMDGTGDALYIDTRTT